MKKILSLAAILALTSQSLVTPSFAADVAGDATSDCTCVTAIGANGIGSLNEPVGSVLVSDGGAYSQATSAITLSDGSQVAVGAGSASLSVGSSCNLSLGANSLATVTSVPGTSNLCVRITELDAAGFAALTGSAVAGGSNLPLIIVGVAGIAGIAAIVSIGNSSVSP